MSDVGWKSPEQKKLEGMLVTLREENQSFKSQLSEAQNEIWMLKGLNKEAQREIEDTQRRYQFVIDYWAKKTTYYRERLSAAESFLEDIAGLAYNEGHTGWLKKYEAYKQGRYNEK